MPQDASKLPFALERRESSPLLSRSLSVSRRDRQKILTVPALFCCNSKRGTAALPCERGKASKTGAQDVNSLLTP